MSWWGKLIGGAFGYMLGGPLGALLGAAFGHNFDAGLRKSVEYDGGRVHFDDRERTQTAFFTASFAVMGRLAKADGQVTADEIRMATTVMNRMGLNAAQRQAAQTLFAEGKRPDFPLNEVLDQLKAVCHRRHSLLRMFLEIQFQAAYADGVVHPEERRLLLHICERLGFSRREFNTLEAMIRAEHRLHSGRERGGRVKGVSLEDAYDLLNVSAESDVAAVKKAYRRLMSQHHPDKLVAKGLPEEMIKLATEKTQEIQAAYEKVKEARGF